MASKSTSLASGKHVLDIASPLADASHGQHPAVSIDEQARERQEQNARSAALETEALYQAHCDNAAQACWYLCRSLGLARQMEADGEPTLELLFQLLGALADLPADIASQPMPEQQGGDNLGVFELCQQLASAREQSQDAWVEAELAAPTHALTH
ncbi:MAG: hypothetical protein K2W93_20215 [Burkholderiaceae bacterium]|nr:hypothetical protein [Burkholderiaceae bacterium]